MAEIMQEAADRNVRVEFHRSTRVIVLPVASGRLIDIEEESLLLDDPQIIGRDTKLEKGSTYDCFFKLNEAMYRFSAPIEGTGELVQLNKRRTITGIRISYPSVLGSGQRRQTFRTSLATDVPIPIKVHTTCNTAPEATPIDAMHDTGVLVDASSSGLGIRIDRPLRAGEIGDWSKLFVGFKIPGEIEYTRLLTEIRQVRRVLDNRATRLGVMVLPWPTSGAVSRATAPLDRYLTQVQRRIRAA